MNKKIVWVGVLSLSVCAAVASATSIDVSAANPNGWTWATQQGSWSTVPVAEFIGVNDSFYPSPNGKGSFHMQTGYSDSSQTVMQRVYLGTNNHSGASVRDVTSFTVTTLLRNRDYENAGLPPLVEVRTTSGTTGQDRLFVAFPKNGAADVVPGQWQTWDLMDPDQVVWKLINTSSGNYQGDWAWLTTRYGTAENPARFQAPGDWTGVAGGDWYDNNITKTSISVKIGAGNSTGLGTDNHFPGSWWQEASSINGYVSNLTIGINGVEYSYNFVPEPATLSFLALGGLALLRRRR